MLYWTANHSRRSPRFDRQGLKTQLIPYFVWEYGVNKIIFKDLFEDCRLESAVSVLLRHSPLYGVRTAAKKQKKRGLNNKEKKAMLRLASSRMRASSGLFPHWWIIVASRVSQVRSKSSSKNPPQANGLLSGSWCSVLRQVSQSAPPNCQCAAK